MSPLETLKHQLAIHLIFLQTQTFRAEVVQAPLLREQEPVSPGVQERGLRAQERRAAVLGPPEGVRGHARPQPHRQQVRGQAGGAVRGGHDGDVPQIHLCKYHSDSFLP